MAVRNSKPRDTRRGRTAETEQSEESVEGLIEEVPPQMAFFEALHQIPSVDWGHYHVFLYRIEPRVRNSGPAKYIDIFEGPFNEADIKERHGGGKYKALLKNQDSGQLERTSVFEIEGAAKLFRSQVVLDEKGNEIPVAPAPAAAPAVADANIVEVLKQLVTALDNKKMPADEAIRTALDTLGQAQKGAMEIVLNAAQAKAGSQTGNPLLDKILENVLTKMAAGDDGARKVNPVSDLKDLLTTMREFRSLAGMEENGGKKGSFLDEARGLAEILKADTDGSLRGMLFGKNDDDQMPATGWGAAFKFFGDAISRRPEILDHGARLLGAMADRLSSRPGTPQPAVVRAVAVPTPATLAGSSEIQPSAATTTQPITAAATPSAASEQTATEEIPPQVIEALLGAVASGYVQDYAGAVVAESLAVLYPTVVPKLQTYLNLPDALVMMWLRQQKVLEAIVKDPEFPEFFHEFKQSILHPESFIADSSPETPVSPGENSAAPTPAV